MRVIHKRSKEELDAVLYAHMGLRPDFTKASEASGIPTSTLWDRWNVLKGKKLKKRIRG